MIVCLERLEPLAARRSGCSVCLVKDLGHSLSNLRDPLGF